MTEVKEILDNLDRPWVIHGVVFFVNLLIFFISRPLLGWFNKGKDVTVQSRALRFGAVLFFILHLLDILLVSAFPKYEHYFIRFGLTIATFFGCLLSFNLLSYFSRQKFGRSKEIDGETVFLDSYNSRLMDLISAFLIILIALYCLIVIWELEGLLQTTGFLGIVFAFLALTNAIWAPDIYYGMVILNTDMLEDGDVVKLGDTGNEYIINRVTLIYTIFLDVRNNHRILLRNSQVLGSRVDNLSKRASADGLRHSMEFNIGYPNVVSRSEQVAEILANMSNDTAKENIGDIVEDNSEASEALNKEAAANDASNLMVENKSSDNKVNPEDQKEHRDNEKNSEKSSGKDSDKLSDKESSENNSSQNDVKKSKQIESNSFDDLNKRVNQMFEAAFEELMKSKEAKLNPNTPFEVTLIRSGDYALTYSLNFYLDKIPNTKVTKTIRSYLTRTPSLVQDAVNSAAVKHGIVLATPVLIEHKQHQ